MRYQIVYIFLSTPSARRATEFDKLTAKAKEISIHALREEGDLYRPSGALPVNDFYPRPPRGGRLPIRVMPLLVVIISIHALREEGDPLPLRGIPDEVGISIHALREEGDST